MRLWEEGVFINEKPNKGAREGKQFEKTVVLVDSANVSFNRWRLSNVDRRWSFANRIKFDSSGKDQDRAFPV